MLRLSRSPQQPTANIERKSNRLICPPWHLAARYWARWCTQCLSLTIVTFPFRLLSLPAIVQPSFRLKKIEPAHFDSAIDAYKKARGRKSLPHEVVKQLLPLLFPHSSYKEKAGTRVPHKISTRTHDLVLKTADAKYIRRDYGIFASISGKGRAPRFCDDLLGNEVLHATKHTKKEEGAPHRTGEAQGGSSKAAPW